MMSVVITVEEDTTAVVGIPSLRTRPSSMMTDMEATNTTKRQLWCRMMVTVTMDTVEKNTEMNIEMTAWWTMPLDGLAVK